MPMNNDPAHEETERLLAEMEKKVAREYKQAAREAESKLNAYMDDFKEKDSVWKKMVEDGQKTEKEYEDWRFRHMAVGKRWENLKDTLAEDYLNADKAAKSIINGYMPEVYATNFNYGTYEAEAGANVNTGFTLYDKQTVERLMRDDPDMLPQPGKKVSKAIAEGKAVRWNKNQIQSVMTQGILQGESIPKLARRLASEVADKDYRAAVRNARTMTTGAQNAGRVDSYERAEEMGIDMEQEWRATLDGRTRHTHALMDGETQKVGDAFSNGLMYPGDPSGEPEEVYNCRCTLRAIVVGLQPMARQYRSTEDIDGMTYEEWKDYHRKALGEETTENIRESNVIVEGTDISETWVRRADQFDFAIDDIVNAQGFDGLPKVLDDSEFENAVKESGLVFARGYSAPDEETLQAYHDQLLNGKWYIDCSKGGAVHGQGMYTAGNYGTKISDKTANLMESYSIGIGRTETMTLVKDAKIITDDALREKKEFLKYDYAKELIKKDLSADEDLVLKAMTMPGSMSFSEAAEALSKSPETSKAVYEEWAKVSKQVMDNISKLPTDQGQLAALFGYDAIEVNVSSRGDKYFVILNRTKLIIKR